MSYPDTEKILERIPGAEVIYIRHYKDVFNRRKQNRAEQYKSRSLILAVNGGELIYKGAPVCQDFGQDRFYYTASTMNCPFDCEYCFLKGMYNTANIVCFVNFEDYAKAVEKLDRPYICASYDTDLIGLNALTGQADRWVGFAASHPDVLIELRTKAAPSDLTPLPNLIYAFTLSPDEVTKRFERGTPSLSARISAARRAVDRGCAVRICFDPMIYIRGWENCYNELADRVAEEIGFDKIRDVSVGTFRISSQYLSRMRRQELLSEVCWFPYDTTDGYSSYPEEIDDLMQTGMCRILSKYMDEGRIWRWR